MRCVKKQQSMPRDPPYVLNECDDDVCILGELQFLVLTLKSIFKGRAYLKVWFAI